MQDIVLVYEGNVEYWRILATATGARSGFICRIVPGFRTAMMPESVFLVGDVDGERPSRSSLHR